MSLFRIIIFNICPQDAINFKRRIQQDELTLNRRGEKGGIIFQLNTQN
jgi:hypothetical protein